MPPRVWKALQAWQQKVNKVTTDPGDEKLKNQFLDNPNAWVVKGGLAKKDYYTNWSNHNNYNENKRGSEDRSQSSLRDRNRDDGRGGRHGRQRHRRDDGRRSDMTHRFSRSASRGRSYDSRSRSRSPPSRKRSRSDDRSRYGPDPYDRSNTPITPYSPSVTSRRTGRGDRDDRSDERHYENSQGQRRGRGRR